MSAILSDGFKFAQRYPEGYAAIRRHRESSARLRDAGWGFIRGSASEDGSQVWATYECGAASGWGYDLLTITAVRGDGDAWTTSHTLVSDRPQSQAVSPSDRKV